MRRVLIGFTILIAGIVVVLSARKGLEEHSGSKTEATQLAQRDLGGSGLGSSNVGGSGNGPDPREASSPPNSSRPIEPTDTITRISADDLRPTDTGPTHAIPEPRPLAGGSTSAEEGRVAQGGESARALRRAAELYSESRSIEADFTQRSVNPILRSSVESSGTLYQRGRDRFLMRFSDPEGDLIVSDGTHFWVYYPSVDRRQVMRLPASRGPGAVDLRAQFVGDPFERFTVVSEGEEELSGRRTHRLQLTPRTPLGYRSLRVWVDAEDYLVRRFEVVEESGVERLIDLSNLKLNVDLPDDLFHFTVPDGVQVVDRG